MSDLKVLVSKGRTVATILEAEFPPLNNKSRSEGGRPDKLISFKTMAYVQANILLCATYMTPKEDLLERARTFQDSLEAGCKKDHTSDTTSESERRDPNS